MEKPNFCRCGDGLSRCDAEPVERIGCEFFFPSGGKCLHFRGDMGGHCSNVYAQHAARNNGNAGDNKYHQI